MRPNSIETLLLSLLSAFKPDKVEMIPKGKKCHPRIWTPSSDPGAKVRLNPAPEPAEREPPGVHVVADEDGQMRQFPVVAIEPTDAIAPPELVVTFKTGLTEQPGPLHVIVPDTDSRSLRPGRSRSWGHRCPSAALDQGAALDDSRPVSCA
jgi:hypothetical protein